MHLYCLMNQVFADISSTAANFNYEEENEAGDDEHGHRDATGGAANPHIWLDPILAKHQIDKIRDVMVSSDPANADHYNQNADRFTAELDSLDAFIRSELADCNKSYFIAFHDAFTHFSER